MRAILFIGAVLFTTTTAFAQQQRDANSLGGGNCANNVYNCAETPNPLPEANTVWIEEMTWMDVRDALSAVSTTTSFVQTVMRSPENLGTRCALRL